MVGLITNLFIAYGLVPGPVFKAYMTNHQDAYMDSKADYTDEKLMEIAINKHKMLMESETWNAPTAHSSQIIVLTAEIDALKKKESKPTQYNNKKSPKSQQIVAATKPTLLGRRFSRQPGSRPTTVGNTTYNWCIHHKYWTVHSSADCQGINGATEPSKSKKEKNQATNIFKQPVPLSHLQATTRTGNRKEARKWQATSFPSSTGQQNLHGCTLQVCFYYLLINYHFCLNITKHFIWHHPNRKKESTDKIL